MQPTRPLWRLQADLLAADAGSLGAVSAMHLHLAAADFSPSLDLALGTLTEATFVGSTALNAGTGTQPTYYDSLTGLLTLRIKEPAGGWSWVCTVDPGTPETIYGVYLTDTANAVLYGSQKLAQPQTIQAAGQGFSIGEVVLQFRINSPF